MLINLVSRIFAAIGSTSSQINNIFNRRIFNTGYGLIENESRLWMILKLRLYHGFVSEPMIFLLFYKNIKCLNKTLI